MNLLPEWRLFLNKAWSVKFVLLSTLLTEIDQLLPYFVDSMPRGVFAALSMFAALGAIMSSTIAQPKTLPLSVCSSCSTTTSPKPAIE